jgi:hypothetical protein
MFSVNTETYAKPSLIVVQYSDTNRRPWVYSGATGTSGGTAYWAEAFSCQLEYKYLAYLTGKKEYYERVSHFILFRVILDDLNGTMMFILP